MAPECYVVVLEIDLSQNRYMRSLRLECVGCRSTWRLELSDIGVVNSWKKLAVGNSLS